MSLHWSEKDYKKYMSKFDKQIQKVDELVKKSRETERNSKYNNRLTCYNGQFFDSQREADRYQELELLARAGEITALMRQVPFLIEPKNKVNREVKYIADFVYLDCNTRKWVVEDAKGYKTDVYKIKKKAMYNRYRIEIKEV